MQRLKTGEHIFAGRFAIQSLLGSGGSGEVYLARDLNNQGSLVALKVYTENSSADSTQFEVQTRINRESAALSRIKSENIVKVFEFLNENGMLILVQEYLAGGTLQSAIRANQVENQNPKDWLLTALDLSAGLETLHAAGVVHGDIKPGNIGFRDLARKHPVYIDFGQAALVSGGDLLSRSVQALATLPYLAPEKTGFIKSNRDEQADLYSLGATLYEMAAGHAPFREENPKALLDKILNGVAPPLTEVVPGFPEMLSDIVQKLLRKNPNDRYYTARGLVFDLRRCLEKIDNEDSISLFALGKNDRFRELNSRIAFVGRSAELETLTHRLSDTIEGRGGCVFIGAPSGSGKSRLCQEIASTAAQRSVRTIVGKFSEFERNIPLSGILPVINVFLREMELDPPQELMSWTHQTADRLGAKIRILTQRLTSLGEVFKPSSHIPRIEFEDEQRAFVEGLAELIVQMGSRSDALILVLDDLQWADAESMAVVECLAELARTENLGQLLLLGCYRSNEVDQEHSLFTRVLQHQEKKTLIHLGPLSEDESDRLVEHLIDENGSEVTKLQRMSFLLTQGNPFYLREYLGFCLSREIFRPDENGENWIFDSAKAQGASLSHGIASLVSERISELNQESKQLLLVASAVGNEVNLSAIDFLLREKQLVTPMLRSLTELSDKNLIYFDREKLIFVHDKVREAAYQLAGQDLRTDCHHIYAMWLHKKTLAQKRDQSQRGSSSDIFEIAYHLKNGAPKRHPEWARPILLEAGRMALKVFAYRKALEYSQTAHDLLPEDYSTSAQLTQEFIEITELLGDAKALNEDPLGALTLYESIIPAVENKLHKSEILAKLCDCNLILFRYRDSLSAAQQGMKLLNKTIDSTEIRAVIYILFMFIPFVTGILLWFVFGRQRVTEDSREEQVVSKLVISGQVGLFFSRPLCAVSNQMRYTFVFLRQKSNQRRSILISYWAVILATFGLSRIADPVFRNAMKHFEQHPDPICRAFILFCWSYLNEFTRARLKEAHSKHIQALELLENAGESFYRVLTMQGLIQMDEYALGNGESYALHSKYADLILRIKQAPTILDAVLRHHLLTKNTAELARYEALVIAAASANKADGFDTVDACYSNISLGEINLLREDPESALPYLKDAFGSITRHFHRIVYCIFAPVLLATCYIRLNRPVAALPALTFAWVNQLFSAKLLLPKTIFISGELIYRCGLHVLGRWIAQKGIAKAHSLRLPAIFFELRLYLANLIVEDDPDYAQVLYRMCREYFSERQYLYFVDRCDRGIAASQDTIDTRIDAIITSQDSGTQSLKGDFGQKNVELESLLPFFLNLSALSERETLFDEVLSAMCRFTGVEYGILFIHEDGKLNPVRARSCQLENLQNELNPVWGIDTWFFEKCQHEGRMDPSIRPAAWRTPHAACEGSVMIVPIGFNEVVYGYCYLAKPDVNGFFDGATRQVIAPLATQAAISIQNFILAASREVKARLDAELNAARAVQESLLPSHIDVPSTLISYFNEPASETGGDWFHHHYNPLSKRLYVVVGDATGHGLPSTLLTAVVSGAVTAHLRTELEMSDGHSGSIEQELNELAKIANKAVFLVGPSSERFMTMAFVCLDLESGEVGFLNAGHTPPYVVNRRENRISTLPCSGSILGFSDTPHFGFTSCVLSEGDSVFLYTDGLLENESQKGPILPQRVLRKTLDHSTSPETCIQALEQIVRSGSMEGALADDVTAYMFRWDGKIAV